MKTITLNKNTNIPIIGFGTSRLLGNEGENAIKRALDIGYRHIDTAEMYGNEEEVGRAIKSSGIPRADIFITSKVQRANLKRDDVKNSLEQSLKKLQSDYLDLYLIHHPNENIPINETLEVMQELKNSEKIKAIGVSNFTVELLLDALKVGVEISNNQVEYHPSLNQEELREFCQNKNISLTAYAPLGRGQDLNIPEIKEIALKYNRSTAQVILSWLMTKNIIIIPRSGKVENIEDNFRSQELELTEEDIEKINGLNLNNRIF